MEKNGVSDNFEGDDDDEEEDDDDEGIMSISDFSNDMNFIEY